MPERDDEVTTSDTSVFASGRLSIARFGGLFKHRTAVRVVAALKTDGTIGPLIGSGVDRWPSSDLTTGAVFIQLIGTAGNVSPAWPVPVPSVPATSLWRILSAVYNAVTIIAAPGVSLVNAGNGAFLGPSSGVLATTTGKVDLSPKSKVVVPFATTFGVTGGNALDTYDIILERYS